MSFATQLRRLSLAVTAATALGVAGAVQAGAGLTLLPVLYEAGGCDGRPLGPGQVRFGARWVAWSSMRLGYAIGYWGSGPPDGALEGLLEAERLVGAPCAGCRAVSGCCRVK